MPNKSSDKEERALIHIIQWSSALALGTMAAVLYSVKQVSPALKYEISFGTGIAFVSAVALSWAFWRLVFGRRNDLNSGISRSRRRWLLALSVILAAATLVPFVYAFKDVAADKTREVAQGIALAVLALGAVGMLFWRVSRFLNADSRRAADQPPAPSHRE